MPVGPESDLPAGTVVWRRILVVVAYLLLVGGGLWLGRHVPGWIGAADISDGAMLSVLVSIFALYVAMTSIPFVPGAEIGLGLMLTLGVSAVPFVYLGMVAACLIAFWLGRRVPPEPLAAVFRSIGMRHAATHVVDLAGLSPEARGAMLAGPKRRGVIGAVLRYRYVALIVVLNIPGNAIIGGAGGIGLVAGMCGLYRPLGYAVAVALGVLPGPLIFLAASHIMM